MEKCAVHEMLTFHIHAHIKIEHILWTRKLVVSVNSSMPSPDKTTHLVHEIM